MNAADNAIEEIEKMLQTIPLVESQNQALKLAIVALRAGRSHFELVSEEIDTSFTDEFFVRTLLKYGRTEEEAREMTDEIFRLVAEATKTE